MASRIGRLELLFWWMASLLGGGILAGIVAGLTNNTVDYYPLPLPEALIVIAATIVTLRAVVSRFHDIGWPGWALILMFLPFLNVLTLLFLLVIPGQKRENTYGGPKVFLQRWRKSKQENLP